MGVQNTKQISTLLNNIKKGVKLYGVNYINTTLEKLNGDGTKKSKKTVIILKCVCDEFDITMEELISSSSRGEVQEARNVASCLLHLTNDLTIRYIAKHIFGREWTRFVSKALERHRNLDENVKPDQQYKQRYDKIEKSIKIKLK